MQEQSLFSFQLRKYLSMVMKIWPSLRVGARHLADITGPHEQSLLPQRNYRIMTESVFFQTVTNDLHQFIMQHDVKEEDIEDYFNDILDLLNIDQDLSLTNNKVGSVRYMSREVIKVMNQLQDGKTQLVDDFENNVYNLVLQMGVGDAIRQGDESSDDQEGEEQMDEENQGYESQQDEWDQQGSDDEEDEQNKEKTQQHLNKQKQQELEDDGWVIVKKKK